MTDLLDSHIDEQLKAVTKDYRDSALHLACRRKDPDMVKLLTDYDAQVNLVNVRHFVSFSSDVFMYFNFGLSCLICLSWSSKNELVLFFF